MFLKKIIPISTLVLLLGQVFFAQNNEGVISGNFASTIQLYNKDTIINSAYPDHRLGANSFANLNFNKGNFSAGVRLESYLNPLEGYPQGFNGSGLGYRYAN